MAYKFLNAAPVHKHFLATWVSHPNGVDLRTTFHATLSDSDCCTDMKWDIVPKNEHCLHETPNIHKAAMKHVTCMR